MIDGDRPDPTGPSQVVALVGPTASGKSEIALQVALGSGPGVELVSVDSMAVYRGMDIGTTKPSAAVRARVRYHLVDLVDPWEEFTVQQFQAAARRAQAEIGGRGHHALLVGGTGLYLRSLVDDLCFPGRYPEVAAGITADLDALGPEGSAGEEVALGVLHGRLARLDPAASRRIEPTNRRRLIRALEVTIGSGRPFSSFGPGLERYPPSPVVQVGLRPDPATLDVRIAERFARLMDAGLLEEVRALSERPEGIARTARQALGYRELLSHFEDGIPVADAVDEAIRRTRAFARRQIAWFRRDPRIVWLDPDDDPVAWIAARFGNVSSKPDSGGRMTGTVTTTTARARRALHLTKHHGAGNDFLVLVDMDRRARLDGALVQAACHRRFGIGADGVIRVSSGGTRADLEMELWNADGSVAEMSGNGIRCLAQAAVEAGVVQPPRITVWTMAGLRTVDYRPGSAVGTAEASVDMGKSLLGPDQPQEFPERKARQVDMGNPHLVLLGPSLADVDVDQLGSRLQEAYPGGINVEFITAGPGPDAITLRVWERGVGQTQACGTGSAAAAAAAQSWGVVGDRVEVHNPGGVLTVDLAPDGIILSGPVASVAGVDVDRAELLDAARA